MEHETSEAHHACDTKAKPGWQNRLLHICKNAAYTHLIENLRHTSGTPCEELPEFIPGNDGGCIDWDVKDWHLSNIVLNDECKEYSVVLVAADGKSLANVVYAVKKEDLGAENFLTLTFFRSSGGLSCALGTSAFSPGYLQVWHALEERSESFEPDSRRPAKQRLPFASVETATLAPTAWRAVTLPDPPLAGAPPEVAFVVPGVFSAAACDEIVAFAEATSFRPALLSEDSKTGGYPDPDVRQCGMVQIDDEIFAAALWELLKPILASMSWDGLVSSYPASTSGWRPIGVSPKLRVLRYGVGDFFKPHTDGHCWLDPSARSFLTCLAYLNDVDTPSDNGASAPAGGTRWLR